MCLCSGQRTKEREVTASASVASFVHAVNEALGTLGGWNAGVAVCNGHGMRERKSCALAEIHVRSARNSGTPASFPMQDDGLHGIATRAFNYVTYLPRRTRKRHIRNVTATSGGPA